MLLISCFIVVILLLSILKDWLHYKEKTSYSIPEQRKFKKLWHSVGAAIHLIIFGFIAYWFYGFTLYSGAVVMLFVAIRHIIFDQGWNLLEGHNLLYRGSNTIESLAGDWAYMGFKLVHLGFTLFLVLFPDRWTYELPVAFYIFAAGCTLAYKFYHKK